MPAAKHDLDSGVYRTLLESTRAIPWKIEWKTMQFAYIGPQIEALLGWTPASWATVQDWADRMHPEDRQRVVDFCVSQSQAGVDHEADYRALASDGSYVWIRDVVHVVRNDDGTVEALIGFMFDISERKRTEQKLLGLQQELEELSFKDSLTKLSNRRRFDALLEEEWASAQSEQHPLSLLMIDIDFFKRYNDHLGHIQGDECLRRVALALSEGATRPRDFLARFGGEEFVIVLPDTDQQGAERVAARCRDALRAARLPHPDSPVSPLVTISIGVGTLTPSTSDEPLHFIEAVDRFLYRAKEAGRDTVVVAGVVRPSIAPPS